MLAVALILVWAISGPYFNFNDTWQLIINTLTTLVTFLMVFIIQNSQNRDTTALQLKIDELICALDGAHNSVLDLEDLNDAELDECKAAYQKLAEKARQAGQSLEHYVEEQAEVQASGDASAKNGGQRKSTHQSSPRSTHRKARSIKTAKLRS